MMRPVVTIAMIALSAGSAGAAPGGGSSGGSTDGTGPTRIGRTAEGATPLQGRTPGMQVSGQVVDRGGRALDGVVVKMFANGMISGSTTTDPEGAFYIEGDPTIGGNNTTVLWFESPGTELLPANVILSLGDVARERGLYPDCTPRIDFLGSATQVEVVLLTLKERNESVRESECLGRATAP